MPRIASDRSKAVDKTALLGRSFSSVEEDVQPFTLADLPADPPAIDEGRAADHVALFRVSQAAISINDQATVLREIAVAARDVTDVVRVDVLLWHVDADEVALVASATGGDDQPLARRHLPLAATPGLRRALERQTPVTIAASEALSGATDLLGEPAEDGSSLLVPLVVGGESLGVIHFLGERRWQPDGRALHLAQEIAAQTALAIQNARSVERIKRHADEQALLLRVSQAVMSGRTLPEILAEVAGGCLSAEGVDGCRIVLWQPDRDEVELAADENVQESESFYRVGERYPLADWPSYRGVMMAGEARGFSVSDSDVPARERANHLADGIAFVHGIPVFAGESCLGCLLLHSRTQRRVSGDAVRLGRELAIQAAYAIERARLFRQLQLRAETDGLTGLLNHRAGFEAVDRALTEARRVGTSLSLMVVDLDDFKLFNDTHGHQIGDRVLLQVASVLSACVDGRGTAVRYGGDEFLLILPRQTGGSLEKLAQELLQRMAASTVELDGMAIPIRLSIGTASFPRDAESRQELIAYADAAMYAAKELGGGQIGTVERGTRSLEPTPFGALSGLVRAVDRKDRYTKDHSDLVADFAVRLGKKLELRPEEIEALEIAGQLHDVGKVAVPDSILRKPGRLLPEEEAAIRQHVVFSEMIIQGVPYQALVQEAVGHHHERWDGAGYPRNRAGLDIPLLGRILAIADAFAAMIHDRPYRKGRSVKEAMDEIQAGAGKQFDPSLVEPFMAAVTTDTALLRDALRRQISSVQGARYPNVRINTTDGLIVPTPRGR